MLTHEDVQKLTAIFLVQEHAFYRGNCYLEEQAISARLDEIDRGWSFLHKETIERGNQISMVYSLTVKGVIRDGVGTADILYTKKDPSKEANEPEKSAATDALKRAARLFGLGRYILDIPRDSEGNTKVQNWNQLESWFKYQGWLATAPPEPAQIWHTVSSNIEKMKAMLNKFSPALTFEYAELIIKKSHTDYETGAEFYNASIAAFDNQPKNPLLNGTDKKPSNQYSKES